MKYNDTATPQKCPNCRTPIWAISTDGFQTKLDTYPLTPLIELVARQAGRHTYLIRKWGTSFIADLRITRDINQTPNPHPHHILTNHNCQYPLTSTKGHPNYWKADTDETTTNPDHCPY